jgi:protein-tyrosine phosphatase
MRDKIYWIPGPWPGRLAILPRPRGGDWLGDETRAWRAAGVDAVVSLLEPQEEAELDLVHESEASTASGLAFLSFPIPDRSVPDGREAVATLAAQLSDALRVGKNVGVHCRQGIGRSALIAAATLISAGEDMDTALRTIAHSRGMTVPETEEQRRWISEFAAWSTSPTDPA